MRKEKEKENIEIGILFHFINIFYILNKRLSSIK